MRTYGTLTHSARIGMFGLRVEPHVSLKLKRWFPRARPNEQGVLVMSDTPEVASELLFMLSRWPLTMSDDVAAHLERRAQEYETSRDTLYAILQGGEALGGGDWLGPVLPPKEMPPELLPPGVDRLVWQAVPADIVLATGRTICGDVLGLGKTMSGLLVLRSPDARPALVVCPPHLQRQWVTQTTKFFPTLRTHIVAKTKVYDPAQVRGANGCPPDILIISYHKLASWADYIVEAIEQRRIRTGIYDEIHKLRTLTSHMYAAGYRIGQALADAAGYRIGLTGTLVFNYGGDAHTIIRIVDRDALGSRDEFVREWGKALGRGKIGVEDPRALGHHLRDQGLHIRRTRKDVGEPELGVDNIAHEIDADQRTLDHLMNGVVDLAELIVAGGDRQEVFRARGDIDWQLRRATGLAKAPYVAEFVKLLLDSEDKVILWGWHRDCWDLWLKKLADFHPALYTGSENARQKALSAARFLGGTALQEFSQQDYAAGRIHEPHREARVLMMSLASGEGLDGLQDVCHVGVFGELAWSPAEHDQCSGRLVDRIGQRHRALMYYLHTPDGSDPVLLETLGVKRQQSTLIRDPTLPNFESANDMSDRPRLLAEQVLARRARRNGNGNAEA